MRVPMRPRHRGQTSGVMAAPARGFTLIELLVVLVIVGVLAGVVVFNFFGAGRERGLQTEAERLAALVELARVESVNRNEAWGLFVHPSEYGFAAYDDAARRWRRHTVGTFRPRRPPAGGPIIPPRPLPVSRSPRSLIAMQPAGAIEPESSRLRLLHGGAARRPDRSPRPPSVRRPA